MSDSLSSLDKSPIADGAQTADAARLASAEGLAGAPPTTPVQTALAADRSLFPDHDA
ncbi:hypothetical protein [Burkholderia anthina]|uniref:hypothetical protein n=1 Tax=Burkholderia anthina TaxID=179879 RepID=UPI001FB7A1C8|nr:hypothetical protein [Burkholderia anthina]